MAGDTDYGTLGCLGAILVISVGGYFGWQGLKEAQSEGEWMLGRDCPFGAKMVGRHPPDGTERWCQEESDNGSFVKHGAHREWYPSGQLKAEGWFAHGKQHGLVHQWSNTGKPTVRRKFTHGEGDGYFLACADTGGPLFLTIERPGFAPEKIEPSDLAERAAKAGPKDEDNMRYAHNALIAWCAGSSRP